jgi:hypothetical protein
MLLEIAQQAQEPVSCGWVIGGLVATVVGLAGYVASLHKAYGKKINEVYDGRIADLKANHALVDTLMRVVREERKGGS